MDPPTPASRSLRARWGAATHTQRLGAVAIIAALCGLVVFLGREERNRQMNMLRAQFHLPPGIEVVAFKPGKRLNRNRMQAAVRFSEPAFQTYVAEIDDARIWRPVPLVGPGMPTIAPPSREALRWRRERPPLYNGEDGMPDWGIFRDEAPAAVLNGLYFCFAIVPVTGGSAAGGVEARAESCWDRDPRAEPLSLVEGVLDLDRRTLHMSL